MANVLKEGKAVCTYAPMGNNGLEGYQEGLAYRFQYMDKDKNGKPYYRVYPSDDSNGCGHYYETCGPNTFHDYFKEIQ